MRPMPHEYIRWIANKEDFDTNKIIGTSDMKRIKDLKGNPLLLFVHEWAVQSVLDKNKGLELVRIRPLVDYITGRQEASIS